MVWEVAAQKYQPLAFVPSVVLPLSLTVTSRQTWEPSKEGRATCSLLQLRKLKPNLGSGKKLVDPTSGQHKYQLPACSTPPHPTPPTTGAQGWSSIQHLLSTTP